MNRRNITKLALMIVVMCFALSTFVSLWSLKLMADQNLRELSRTLAARIYDTVVGELSDPIVVSRTMANDLFLIDILEREDEIGAVKMESVLAEYLSRIKRNMGYEAAFVVSEASRKYYSYGGVNKFLDLESSERDQWYNHFIQTGMPFLMDVDLDEVAEDVWTVFADARVSDQSGKLLGACGVGARMNKTQELINSLEREYRVKISLADVDGVIQVDTQEDNLKKPLPEGILLEGKDDYEVRQLGPARIVITKYIDNLDWYLVVQSDGSRQRGQFINVILLNVVLCLLVTVILTLAMHIIASRAKALANASFTDQATQLLNRRAFEEEKARLTLQPLRDELVYVTADLNGLKTANDTLGHAAGDEMIRGAADCLKVTLGRYGQVYRIGGDEFAAILYLSDGQLAEAMQKLEAECAAYQGRLVKGVSIACGWASSREFPSENIGELSRISDERMYAAKEEYYRRTGKTRRRT